MPYATIPHTLAILCPGYNSTHTYTHPIPPLQYTMDNGIKEFTQYKLLGNSFKCYNQQPK